ncbi:von Willebrand factor A domain-containing protein 5A-like isoform X2 [Hemicordylus capensis]|uniref:von Willebrand factor A domain-containing protein 5A-like isoform X2 n=1 Tax=Hemicordylus capensis TaxID=884348 RepID=UPI0023033004|nr:von Willebrand factor A domain-containing protein 5A-like isoform X2 [Hemicordylus capensis]
MATSRRANSSLQGSGAGTVTNSIPRVPKGQLPYTLSLNVTLEAPCGINRVESKCTLEPLHYTAEDHTTAQVSLATGHQFDRDVELLVYYEDVHKPSTLLEAGKTGAAPGSLMGDPALLLTLYPSIPAPKPGLNSAGEFLFLLDRSGSMDNSSGVGRDSPSRIQSAKETLVLILKSLPLGCYFNIYGFGSTHDSFYPQSVEYTQKTMSKSLQRVKELRADLGGTEILRPLKDIYSQPCREGHPRQLFVFTDGEVFNTDEVIAEVRRHSSSHRCFSFGIGEGASTALIKGIARAAGGSAEFITGKERMQAKALQSLKKALQPAVTGISLRWDLPPGLEAALVGSGPQVIFEGQRCLIYGQIRGKPQSSESAEGSVVLKYSFQDQTLTETMKFPLQAQESDRLPVHRLAAQALLQELEEAKEQDEGKRRLALETSLSSGVVCSQTAYVGVNMELSKALQGPLSRRNIPLAQCFYAGVPQINRSLRSPRVCSSTYSEGVFYKCSARVAVPKPQARRFNLRMSAVSLKSKRREVDMDDHLEDLSDCSAPGLLREEEKETTLKEEGSLLLRLILLQNADGSWPLDSDLATLLDLSEAEISSQKPAQVIPTAWATVLAVLWLHFRAAEQNDEWQLLEAKALSWLQATAGPQLAECVKAGNALLGSSVSPQAFGL